MRFGYHQTSFPDPADASPLDDIRERARRLEDAGFSWFSLMDHLWQIPGNGRRGEPFFDCYTTLPAVAAVTDEMELSALVTCVHYRNPAYLARSLATLDHLSEGRAVLGIGAGWYEAEYDAYGYEFPDAARRISQLADAIRLCKAVWTRDSPVTYEGNHYAVEDLILEPKPVRDPHPPVLVGGGGEQLTLRVAAKRADRWNLPGLTPAGFDHKVDVLHDHCADVGRDPDDIEETVANTVVVRETTAAAHEAYEQLMAETDHGPVPRDEFRGLVGTPAEVAADLDDWEGRADLFVLKVPRNDERTLDLFVDEVLPAV